MPLACGLKSSKFPLEFLTWYQKEVVKRFLSFQKVRLMTRFLKCLQILLYIKKNLSKMVKYGELE